MSNTPEDPSEPQRPSPPPLDYARPTARGGGGGGSYFGSLGTGCLMMLAAFVIVIGVVLGTCYLMR